jgi:hypothetical protein
MHSCRRYKKNWFKWLQTVNEKPGMQVSFVWHSICTTKHYDTTIPSAVQHMSPWKENMNTEREVTVSVVFFRIHLGRILWLITGSRSVIISRHMLAGTVLWNVNLDRNFFYFQIILRHPSWLCYVETPFQMHDVYIMEFGRKVQH